MVGEVQGRLVVVDGEDGGAAVEGDDGGKTDAAAELDGPDAREVAGGQVARERHRARPEVSPVREAFVALELPLVDQGVGGTWVRDAVGSIADDDPGLGQCRAPVEVPAEVVEGLPQPTRAVLRVPRSAFTRSARVSRSDSASSAIEYCPKTPSRALRASSHTLLVTHNGASEM